MSRTPFSQRRRARRAARPQSDADRLPHGQAHSDVPAETETESPDAWTTLTGAPDDFTTASRAALVEALMAAGPGHPTLCEGWLSEHLAAHIHLRESSPWALGLAVKPLAGLLNRRTLSLGNECSTQSTYQDLVARIARGAGESERVVTRGRAARPVRRAAQAANLLEFFVHTEDVRRAQLRWAPRRITPEYADALWDELVRRLGMLYRGEKTGIRLVRTRRVGGSSGGIEEVTVRQGSPMVTITGPTSELTMHAFGRRAHALVLVDST